MFKMLQKKKKKNDKSSFYETSKLIFMQYFINDYSKARYFVMPTIYSLANYLLQ